MAKSRNKQDSHFAEYLRRIAETPLLTALQEVELGKAIEAGKSARTQIDEIQRKLLEKKGPDGGILPGELLEVRRLQEDLLTIASAVLAGVDAWHKMVNGSLRLVVSIAKRYRNNPDRLTLFELVQLGNFGLMRAAQDFDWRRARFSTYATFWIRAHIRRGAGYDVKLRRVEISLDQVVGEDADYHSLVGDEDAKDPHTEVSNSLLREEIARIIAERISNPVIRIILTLRFGLDGEGSKTNVEIGQILGIPAERVRIWWHKARKVLSGHAKLAKLHSEIKDSG